MAQDSISELLTAFPLPALAIDGSERIFAANTEARSLIGGQAIGRNFVTILRQPALLDAVEATLTDGQSRVAPFLGNDGVQDTTFQVSIRAVRLVDATGAVVLVFQDMTPVEQAGQMRRDFVANVSHELRTPLTALLGFIETLRGPARKDPDASDRFLGIMQDEAQRMNRLVGDLMSLNRVESDERVRPTDVVNLVDILDSTLRSLRALAEDASVTFEPALGDSSIDLVADADQVRQVFTNLIENAIKYGGSGGRVAIQVTVEDRMPALRAPGVRVDIIDDGPGIDPTHLPRLTERFYRADDHRSRALGGTGLGLAIVKHIINRHRGRLRVHSVLGQGATFSVILPTATKTE